jgi:hypothetical protein
LTQSQSGSGGLLASFRYGIGHHSAIELNYGFTRNSQTYTNGFFPIAEQEANVHEFTADYVFHLRHYHKLDPFVLAGGGSLVFSPITDSPTGIPFADTQAKGTFLYGAGVNSRCWAIWDCACSIADWFTRRRISEITCSLPTVGRIPRCRRWVSRSNSKMLNEA